MRQQLLLDTIPCRQLSAESRQFRSILVETVGSLSRPRLWSRSEFESGESAPLQPIWSLHLQSRPSPCPSPSPSPSPSRYMYTHTQSARNTDTIGRSLHVTGQGSIARLPVSQTCTSVGKPSPRRGQSPSALHEASGHERLIFKSAHMCANAYSLYAL